MSAKQIQPVWEGLYKEEPTAVYFEDGTLRAVVGFPGIYTVSAHDIFAGAVTALIAERDEARAQLASQKAKTVMKDC